MLDTYVRKLQTFVDLSPDAKAAVRALPADRIKIPRNRTIIRQGSSSDFLYVVNSGWAAHVAKRVDGSRRITGFLLTGDFFGLHAMTGAAMDHDIIAVADCDLTQISISDVRQLLGQFPAIELAIWRSKVVDEALLRQLLRSSADSLQSVARLLCELHARATVAGLCSDGVCTVPLTQEDIGHATGITAIHTNRIIQRLRASELVEFDRHDGLKILNEPDLAAVAEWDPSVLAPWKR